MNPGFGEVMTCESKRLTESESRGEANKCVEVTLGTHGSFNLCPFANVSCEF